MITCFKGGSNVTRIFYIMKIIPCYAHMVISHRSKLKQLGVIGVIAAENLT